MALEIKAYKEVTAYNAKVMLGMSWRQLAVAATTLPILIALAVLLWWLGWDGLTAYLLATVTLPAAAYGWARPKGLAFEDYASRVWDYYRSPKVRQYRQTRVWRADMDSKEARTGGRKTTQAKHTRRAHARQGAWEATH